MPALWRRLLLSVPAAASLSVSSPVSRKHIATHVHSPDTHKFSRAEPARLPHTHSRARPFPWYAHTFPPGARPSPANHCAARAFTRYAQIFTIGEPARLPQTHSRACAPTHVHSPDTHKH